ELLARFLADNDQNNLNIQELIQQDQFTHNEAQKEATTIELLPGLKKMREGQAQVNLEDQMPNVPPPVNGNMEFEEYDFTSEEETETEEDSDIGEPLA
ncbi:hypothetical protein H0H93_003888, partial [Arthromyces matolae]